MNHRPGLDRNQTLLFPERLEDYVAAVDSQGGYEREHSAGVIWQEPVLLR